MQRGRRIKEDDVLPRIGFETWGCVAGAGNDRSKYLHTVPGKC